LEFIKHPVFKKSVVCTTLESDCQFPDFMGYAPHPIERTLAMQKISDLNIQTYVTIEPIMDFRLEHFTNAIKRCNPIQVNIGADSGHNNLPEPPKEKVLELISALEEFTKVKQKCNLKRIFNQ
jgi:hypothetical protein